MSFAQLSCPLIFHTKNHVYVLLRQNRNGTNILRDRKAPHQLGLQVCSFIRHPSAYSQTFTGLPLVA